MPNKHFYFAMGATSGVAICWIIRKSRFWLLKHTKWMNKLYRWDRHWFLYFPILIGICGVVAWVPDILHALNILEKDVTRSEFFNLFFFHSYFEQLENSNPQIDQFLNWIGDIILFSIAIGILFFYVLQLKRHERKRK